MARLRFPCLAGLLAVLHRIEKPLHSRRFPLGEEREFLEFYAERTYPQARFGITLGFFAWNLFFVWDDLGFPAITLPLALIRFGLVAPAIGWLWWLSVRHPDRFKARMQGYLALAPAAVGLGLFLMFVVICVAGSRDAFHLFWPSFAGLYFFQYAFLGMRPKPAAVLGLLSLVLVAAAGYVSHTATSVLGSALSLLAILNLLGTMICARMEIHERTVFRLRQRYHRQVRTARKERQTAQTARDEAMLDRARAEAAMMLARAERGRLATAIEERERFFSAAYHDLQQPLSIIGLYARLARNKLETADPAAIEPDLAIIEGAGQDIALMFKGVRETFEIGRAEPTVEAVELNDVLDEIVRELRERAAWKALTLRLRKGMRSPLWVRSDRQLLKRALSNLAGNAIKYTERGGVLIGAVALGQRVRVDVWDTGPGIPPEYQDRIFEEYFRVRHGESGRKRGLGLGLAIVRRIERNLPGHGLGFRSCPGRGSRFSLSVPAAPEAGRSLPNPGPAGASAIVADLEDKYVVIVEDEPAILAGLIRAVQNAGCLAEGADSADSARKLFEERDRCPDILVTDYRLRSGQTGLDAVAALRRRFEWATDVPVLFITGDLLPESALLRFKGIYSLYRKPIDPDVLLGKLKELLDIGKSLPGGPHRSP